MSDDQKSTGGAPDDKSGGQDQDQQAQTPGGTGENKDNKVEYSTFSKVLDEKKATQARLQEAENKLKQMELEQAQASGDKQKQLEIYEKQLSETKGKLKDLQVGYATERITSTVKDAAVRMGCTKPDVFVKLFEDWDSLSPDENFQINSTILEAKMEEMKKDHPYLFQKKAPGFVDSKNLSTQQQQSGDWKQAAGKTAEELKAWAIANADKIK